MTRTYHDRRKILERVLGEADELIRRRLEERGLELPSDGVHSVS